MKKIFLVIVLSLSVWNLYFQKAGNSNYSFDKLKASIWPSGPASQSSNNFSCDGRQYCSQMTSRAEALFFINNCPDTRMDGDRDGQPCENDSRF